MNAEEIQLPPEILAKIKEKSESMDSACKAIYFHFAKHKLTNLDCLTVLSAVFQSLKISQANVDDQTELEMMFVSMIQNSPAL